MIMFFIMFVSLYASMLYVENKVPQINLTTKKRLLFSAGGALLWPVTLTAGVAIGAGVYYHKNVKALPYVDTIKRLPTKK